MLWAKILIGDQNLTGTYTLVLSHQASPVPAVLELGRKVDAFERRLSFGRLSQSVSAFQFPM